MIVPFDPGSMWTNDPEAVPDVPSDDSRGRRRRYIGAARYVVFFLALLLGACA